MFRTSCLLCGRSDLVEIVDLGMHPFADTFVPPERLSESDRLYPLICDLCGHCGQIQLRTVTDPGDRYQAAEYSYTSANSSFSRGHWTAYAADVARVAGLRPADLVIEIGSNDGFLAERFHDAGCRVLGIDPSPAMAKLAAERGIETIVDFFSDAVAEKVVARAGRARLIVANNVVNHANDPLDFWRGIARLLGDDGTFVFELPYWLRLVDEARFDQIYHEHVTYWTATHAAAVAAAVGLTLVRTDEVDYHGGSLRAYCKKHATPDASVGAFRLAESNAGLFAPETYVDLMRRIRHERDVRLEKVYGIRKGGGAIVALGAAAKGNTFLTYYGLDATVVDVVTDASPYKIGKYTPGTRIPITDDGHLASYRDGVHALVLSWNLAETLRAKLSRINPRLEFLFLEDDR